jgi:hypothetical protein
MSSGRYWINVVSKDHTMRGVSGGFMQSCHGKEAPLKRMKPNDWVVFYSPKETMEGDVKCQSFTAIGKIADGEVYQYTMSDDFIPFRRNVTFYRCREVPIAPLISRFEFIKNKTSWGSPFRFGFFEIPEVDFNLISQSMLKND